MNAARPILITGANGRIGQVLHQIWPQGFGRAHRLLWQSRDAVSGDWLKWNILGQPYPGPPLVGGIVLNLAGVTPGPGKELDQNTALALAACNAAKVAGARHVFVVSSAAVYGPGTGADMKEGSPLDPANAYGKAKVAMESAVLNWRSNQTGISPGVTILRIGNILGLDALVGAANPQKPVILDPVPEAQGGPVRSYIGPHTLALTLARLCEIVAQDGTLPPILNISAAPPVAMAALLDAANQPWQYGPPNPAVIARVVLACDLLRRYVPVGTATAASMVAEWQALRRDGR